MTATACGDDTGSGSGEAVGSLTAEGSVAADVLTLLAAEELGTFAEALHRAAPTSLRGEITLLAPTDDAFLRLGSQQLADVLTDPEQLASLVGNHLVSGRFDMDALVAEGYVETVTGDVLNVTEVGDTVTIGGAEVLRSDVAAGDSLVHVVDRLIPRRG